MFKCPWGSSTDSQCQTDLVQCNADKAAIQTQLTTCNQAKATLADQLATLTSQLSACNASLSAGQQAFAALTAGPPAPATANLRVVDAAKLNQLWWEKLGQPYTDCINAGGVHWAWPPWLCCKEADLQGYLAFFKQTFLPLLTPYTVLDWVDTFGNHTQISGRTCSDFSAAFWGIPSLYLGWTPIVWGVVWAQVESLFLSGGHAFNWTLTWDESYVEPSPADTVVSAKGLSLAFIEPQTEGHWNAQGIALDETAKVVGLKSRPIEDLSINYNIKSLYAIIA